MSENLLQIWYSPQLCEGQRRLQHGKALVPSISSSRLPKNALFYDDDYSFQESSPAVCELGGFSIT